MREQASHGCTAPACTPRCGTDSSGQAAGQQTCALARRPWASARLWLHRLDTL